jgi:hypothetical protein
MLWTLWPHGDRHCCAITLHDHTGTLSLDGGMKVPEGSTVELCIVDDDGQPHSRRCSRAVVLGQMNMLRCCGIVFPAATQGVLHGGEPSGVSVGYMQTCFKCLQPYTTYGTCI